jgi:PAS domain S-box-containing protein
MPKEKKLSRILDEAEIFLITNATAVDNPIVYVDSRFLSYTGYDSADFIGRNCRFLQQGEPNVHAVNLAKRLIESKQEMTFSLINYRKDNSKFLNTFKVQAFFGMDNRPSYFVAKHIDFFDIH